MNESTDASNTPKKSLAETMTVAELIALREQAAKVQEFHINIILTKDESLFSVLVYDGGSNRDLICKTFEEIVSHLEKLAIPEAKETVIKSEELPEKCCGHCNYWKSSDDRLGMCDFAAPYSFVSVTRNRTINYNGELCPCFKSIEESQPVVPMTESDESIVKSLYPDAFCLNQCGMRIMNQPYGVRISSVCDTEPEAWRDAAKRVMTYKKSDEYFVKQQYATAVCVKCGDLFHVTIGCSGWMGQETPEEAWSYAAKCLRGHSSKSEKTA